MEENQIADKLAEAIFNPESAQQQSTDNNQQQATETQAEIEAKAQAAQQQAATVIDPIVVLKENLGFEDWNTAKTEFETLRKLKENPTSAIQFANDFSATAYDYVVNGKEDDLFEVLKSKRELAAIDKLSADEVIKLNIQYANKHFSKADVQDVFEENYKIPKEPVQTVSEDDTEFEIRHNEWKESEERVKRKIERDSVSAKTNLSQLVPNIVLPKIVKEGERTQEQVQQELDAQKNYDTFFTNEIESNYKNFNGFKTSYKDGNIEVPIVFEVTDEDKTQTKAEILADYQKAQFIANRWFDSNGKPNVTQMQEDIYLLKNRDIILQNIAAKSAGTAVDNYVKKKKNVSDFSQSNQDNNGGSQIDIAQQIAAAVFN